MKLPTAKYLKNKARIRLESGQEPQKVVLYYAGISAALAIIVMLIQYLVSRQMSQAGGLQNIGTRSALSTISSVASILKYVVMMMVSLGYAAAMLRISRKQYASPKTLKAGVERFWVLLRARLLMGAIYFGAAFALSYPAAMLFMMTPLSRPFVDTVVPLITNGTFTTDPLMNSEILTWQMMTTLIPMMIIYFLLLIPVYLFLNYVYRFTDYLLIDQPGIGAMAAMRQSRTLTRGNLWNLFKIDLSFWWFYVLQALVMMIPNADVLLDTLGISVPYLVPFFAFLAADAAVTILFRNRLEVTFALAYDSLLPKEKQEGIVLGNIFQM